MSNPSYTEEFRPGPVRRVTECKYNKGATPSGTWGRGTEKARGGRSGTCPRVDRPTHAGGVLG